MDAELSSVTQINDAAFLKMEAVHFSKILLKKFNQATWRHTPEDSKR
jgi:hypothetical protein